jgi:guanylate kinase
MEALKERLEKRGTDSPESIQKRLDKAAFELSFQERFDQIILNDRLEEACQLAAATLQLFLQPQSLDSKAEIMKK